MAPRSRYYLLLVVLSVLVGSWYKNTRRPGHDWGDDFAQYLRHARNLATGQPYKQSGHLLNPRYQIGPEVYPPVFPLLLAPVLSGTNPWDFQRFKLVGIGCAAAFLLVWGWRLTAEAEAERLAPAAWPTHLVPLVVLVAVCPVVWGLKDHILSDLPYLLLQTLAFGAIAWFRQGRAEPIWRQAVAAVGLGAVLWLPYGCRTTGFLLVGAFVGETAWRHRRNVSAARWPALALAVTVGLALVQRAYLDSHDAGYSAQLRTYFSAAQVAHNAQLYWNLACRYWGEQPGLSSGTYSVLGVGTAALVVLGWRRRWRETPFRAEEVYFVGYLLLVVLWPMPQGERLLLPLLPLAIVYGWVGARNLPGAWGRQLPTILAALLVLVGRSAISRSPPIAEQFDEPDNRRLMRWVAAQPRQAIFLSEKPRALGLYGAHRAMVLRSFTDPAIVTQDIAASGAQFLITRRDSTSYIPAGAQVSFTTKHLWVLKL